MSDHLPDRFLASSPALDAAANVWRVLVLLACPIIGPVGQTGEILVSATSEEIVSYSPLEEMKTAARSLHENNRDAIEAPFGNCVNLRSEVAMSKALTPYFAADGDIDYEQAVQQMFDEMTKANEKMERDQEEIEQVKAETREILARLKAA
ncbi:MAG: hypothetical protein AABO57_20910 [Acidobacteriota bacterium]